MLIIEDNVIYVHKGDDASITVSLMEGNVPYEMDESDTLTLTVRETPVTTGSPLLTTSSHSNVLSIAHSAWGSVEPGQYSADIQLAKADGSITTLWPLLEKSKRAKTDNMKNFVVMAEVTTT